MRWPSWIPAGTSTSSVASSTTRPAPSHVPHGDSTTRPGALAARARSLAHDLAEDALRDLLDASRTPAGGTGDGLRALRRPGATARRAGTCDPGRNRDGRPDLGLREGDLDPDGQVGAARRPLCPRAAAEQPLAEEGREDVGEVAEIEVGRMEATSTQPGVPVAVVGPPPLWIGEDLVCLGDLAEALVRVGLVRDVRVQLARELAERPLDLRLARVSPDAEQLVVIAVRGHGPG